MKIIFLSNSMTCGFPVEISLPSDMAPAITQLRMYGAAADELRSVGDFNSPRLRYEEHPSEYPGRSGSFVPFALRWLHAELPHRLGQSAATMDRLYSLLELCKASRFLLLSCSGIYETAYW